MVVKLEKKFHIPGPGPDVRASLIDSEKKEEEVHATTLLCSSKGGYRQ